MVYRVTQNPYEIFVPNLLVQSMQSIASLFHLIARCLFGTKNSAPKTLSQHDIKPIRTTSSNGQQSEERSACDAQTSKSVESSKTSFVRLSEAPSDKNKPKTRMNFPSAVEKGLQNENAKKALLKALDRVIEKIGNDNSDLIKFRETISKNGLPKDINTLCEDFDNLDFDKLIKTIDKQLKTIDKQLQFWKGKKTNAERAIKEERGEWLFRDNEILELNEGSLERANNKIDELRNLKADLLSVVYFLKPNALMTMRPTKMRKTADSSGRKKSRQIDKPTVFVEQEIHSDHRKVEPKKPFARQIGKSSHCSTSVAPPKSCRGFFSICFGTPKYEKGERYKGIPRPVQKVLPSSYRQIIPDSTPPQKVPAPSLPQPSSGLLLRREKLSINDEEIGKVKWNQMRKGVKICKISLRASSKK